MATCGAIYGGRGPWEPLNRKCGLDEGHDGDHDNKEGFTWRKVRLRSQTWDADPSTHFDDGPGIYRLPTPTK